MGSGLSIAVSALCSYSCRKRLLALLAYRRHSFAPGRPSAPRFQHRSENEWSEAGAINDLLRAARRTNHRALLSISDVTEIVASRPEVRLD